MAREATADSVAACRSAGKTAVADRRHGNVEWYRGRDANRKEGASGFRPIGRAGGGAWRRRPKRAEDRITERERKIGQQAVVIKDLRRGFGQPNKGNGGTGSRESSRP